MTGPARLDKRPRPVKEFSFAWLTVPGKGEVAVFVVKILGNDLYYRLLKEDGTLNGMDSVIFWKTATIRGCSSHDFKLMWDSEQEKVRKRKSRFEISLPTAQGTFEQYIVCPSRVAAIRLAKQLWGTDGRGRVRIVNELP
jgi:hypothetical protein